MSRNYYAPELIHNHQRPRPQGVKHGGMNHIVNFPLTNDSPVPLPREQRRRTPGRK
jgi:hypothetical protein